MEKDVFSIFRFESLEKIRSGEEVEYRQKSHSKISFLLPGKVNGPLNNIFTL